MPVQRTSIKKSSHRSPYNQRHNPRQSSLPAHKSHANDPPLPLQADTMYHKNLPDSGRKSTGIYTISDNFIKAVQHLFTDGHKSFIPRQIAITKHYFEFLVKVFPNNHHLAEALKKKNDFLWENILQPYAEAWRPRISSLSAQGALEMRMRWRRVKPDETDLAHNAWTIARSSKFPDDWADLFVTLPQNPDDRPGAYIMLRAANLEKSRSPDKENDAQDTRAESPQKAGLSSSESFRDPIHDPADMDAPSKATTDVEAKKQILPS